MQSVPLFSNQQTGQPVFQQLQALLKEDYDNRKNIMPGETCYILAHKSIPFMIQYLIHESQEALMQIRKANTFLLQSQEQKNFIYFQERFKNQVSHECAEETLKVKIICRGLYESLLKEIDLSGIAVERRATKKGIDLHPLRIEVSLISGNIMKEVLEDVKYFELNSLKQIVFEKIMIHIYENESIGQILRRLGMIINKKETEMRLYHYDDSLFKFRSFPGMIKYFLNKEDTQLAVSEQQMKFYELQKDKNSLDENYLVEFFPGKLIRPENTARLSQKEDKYVLELNEGGWVFPKQPQFSIAKNCKFCSFKMQLYINFACQQCSNEFLFCSRACHYQFLLEHHCKQASKLQISIFYGEQYLL